MTEFPKPTFSVVIPVFNKGPHIYRSVSSVLNQSFKDFELILINDASTDNSLEEINKFHDPRIRNFHRESPGPGGYAARNMGVEKAIGDWIAFLDADDQWFPEHLAEMLELSKAFPECQFLSCGWQNVFPNGSLLMDEYARYNAARDWHTISFLDYLILCVKDKRPTLTSVVCIKNNEFAVSLFPEGRASRGGDLHAWRSHLARSRTMAWSPHLGAIYHRDSVNMVTELATSSTNLATAIVQDFEPFVDPLEMRLLKKDCNRNLFREWLRHRLINEMPFNLVSNLYWYGDTVYCLTRLPLSLLPVPMLKLLVKFKGAVRRSLGYLRNFR